MQILQENAVFSGIFTQLTQNLHNRQSRKISFCLNRRTIKDDDLGQNLALAL